MKIITFAILSFLIANSVLSQQIAWNKINVLVYTKNGKGYVHDNIPFAVNAIINFGKQYGFRVDTSSSPLVMTESNLKQYTMLIFPSTNNDVFDTDLQRLAFRKYIEAGGGFVGIHSVTGTERKWEWFKMLLGGTFSWHAKFQKFTVRVINTKHPAMKGTPAVWEKEDECYFAKELYPGPQVLMVNDFSTIDTSDQKQKELLKLHAGTYAKYYPSAWVYDFDGGYTWCTTLGHHKKDYSDKNYLSHIWSGIAYIAGKVKKINFSKSYAKHYNDPVQF
ncbi:MAG: ThuA domain-containing protein [Niabella sp.]